MAVYLSPIANDQQYDSNGSPLVGGYWNAFLAGTSTPVTTYTSNTGGTSQPTNIVLNSAGRPANPIWLTGGQPVKLQLFSASAVLLLTIDNVSGLNDPAGVTTQDQWVLYGATATFVSATSFSVVGDQTGTFQVGRRLKSTNTGGTIYSTIATSVFGAVTTVTVTNDSGVLDSGLSAMSYGLLSVTNPSIPKIAAGQLTMSQITASLGADVNLNNTANYFDGPSIAQGSTGVWWVEGTISVTDTVGQANVDCKLWDGTTVISSCRSIVPGVNQTIAITLSGWISAPAGNLRISAKDPTAASGVIKFNATGNSKDSTISAMRIG